MVSNNVKKVISMVLVLLMTCSSMVFAAGADYAGHWAEDSIQNWVDKGYVKGFKDGTFKPENEITRAEFITLVNRSFGFTEEKEVTYKDVKASHWAYKDFKRAHAVGYIGGYEDGTLRPNAKITREEAASIIVRLLNLSPAKDSEAFLDLADVDAIPKWSADAVSAMVDKGYINLRNGNTFAPTLPATRAEVIAALDSSYLTVTKVTYSEAGTYTAGVVEGSVEINAKDVILEDTTINGNLIIGEGVGSGDVTLNNVTVKGNTVVKGGGMNSIIITDSQIKNLIVEKKDGKVRILAKGETYVQNVDMKSGGKLESSDLKADNFGSVVIAEKLISTEPIILAGNFDNVEVKSGKNEIKVLSGTISSLVVSKTAKDAKVNLAEGVNVDKVEINAAITIDGKGKIETAVVNANGVKITAPVETIKEATGIDKVETTNPSTGGSSGGGGGGGTTIIKTVVEKVVFTANGETDTLAITLSQVPTTTPTAMSVNVTRAIDDENDDSFEWGDRYSSWNKESKTLTIYEISPVKATDKEQVVSYTVSYGGTVGLKSNEVKIPALDSAIKITSVSAVNGTVTVTMSKAGSIDSKRFTIEQSINDEKATMVELIGVSISDDVFTFTIPMVPDTGVLRPVFIYVSLDGGDLVSGIFMIGEEETPAVDPVATFKALEATTVARTRAAIKFTSGSEITLTTNGAITLTTGAAISLTTSQSINLELDNEVTGHKVAYKFSSDKVDVLPEGKLDSPEYTVISKEMEFINVDKDKNEKYLVFYELNEADEAVSYINIGMIDNPQK